ncbi:MAG: nucleotidyltransferase domain-containing protein [Acidobacteria bacterium]|nr:nucleotidyltransferase domain-containing protein [Acidobacteriota bacterium]
MFTPEYREELRSRLLARAASDARLSGTAITGSAANARSDRWSDIDLAFGVRESRDLADALADWTSHMYAGHGAVHHVDVQAGAWTYRVFLLSNTLQVDLAFVAEDEFRALSPEFQLVSGTAREPQHMPQPPASYLIGFGWLYALHVRSSIARTKHWQAEFMISGMRDTALALACLRHGLPAVHGRGLHQLPAEVTKPFGDSLVRTMDAAELSRAFGVTLELLAREIGHADAAVAARLEPALRMLLQSDF